MHGGDRGNEDVGLGDESNGSDFCQRRVHLKPDQERKVRWEFTKVLKANSNDFHSFRP